MGKSRFFQFEAKFGWAELIAVVAVCMSALAIFQQSRGPQPDVIVTDLDAQHLVPSWTPQAANTLVVVQPLLASNTGGRPVTLVALTATRGQGPGILLKEGQSEPVRLRIEAHLTGALSEAWRLDSQELFRGELLEAGRRVLVNRTIEAGGSTIVHVAFVFEAYDGLQTRADYLAIGLEALFSNGTVVPIRLALPIPPRRTGR